MGIELARRKLLEDRIRLGPEPHGPKIKATWKKNIAAFHDAFDTVNAKISKLNMVTPTMRQQMVPYSKKHVQNELDIILQTYQLKRDRGDLDTKKPPAEPVIHYVIPDRNDKTRLKDVWSEWKALFSSPSP